MSSAFLSCIHVPLSVLSQRFHNLTLIRTYSLELGLFPVVHMWISQEEIVRTQISEIPRASYVMFSRQLLQQTQNR